MVVISKTILNSFCKDYPEVTGALSSWYEVTSQANWKSFSEVRRSFNSTDFVGNDRYVFNIKGNKFRLIALIIFRIRTVFILFVGDHKSYDLVDAKTIRYKPNR